jgi:hypothetical protein
MIDWHKLSDGLMPALGQPVCLCCVAADGELFYATGHRTKSWGTIAVARGSAPYESVIVWCSAPGKPLYPHEEEQIRYWAAIEPPDEFKFKPGSYSELELRSDSYHPGDEILCVLCNQAHRLLENPQDRELFYVCDRGAPHYEQSRILFKPVTIHLTQV